MAKKGFKGDLGPAAQFIGAPAAPPLPQGARPSPPWPEPKSRRLQLLVRPSLHKKLKARADSEGKSVNGLCCEILEAAFRAGP